jgi:hypothetical protein
MFDSLDNIKNTYGKYGGRDPDFVGQVRDMENYLHFNRPPPLNPLSSVVPISRAGPATIYAAP